jgi:hypothetical protein
VPITKFRREFRKWLRLMERREHGVIVLTRRRRDCVVVVPQWLHEQLAGEQSS